MSISEAGRYMVRNENQISSVIKMCQERSKNGTPTQLFGLLRQFSLPANTLAFVCILSGYCKSLDRRRTKSSAENWLPPMTELFPFFHHVENSIHLLDRDQVEWVKYDFYRVIISYYKICQRLHESNFCFPSFSNSSDSHHPFLLISPSRASQKHQSNHPPVFESSSNPSRALVDVPGYLGAIPNSFHRTIPVLISAIDIYNPNRSVFTPFHPILANACDITQKYSYFADYFDKYPVCRVETYFNPIDTPEPLISPTQVMKFWSIAGDIYSKLCRFDDANHSFLRVFSVPATSLHSTAISAYKKYLLTSLIEHGSFLQIPSRILPMKYHQALKLKSEWFHNFADIYTHAAESSLDSIVGQTDAYKSAILSRFNAQANFSSGVSKRNKTNQNGNFLQITQQFKAILEHMIGEKSSALEKEGLMHYFSHVMHYLKIHNLKKLTVTYQTLPISDITKCIGTNSDMETRDLIIYLVSKNEFSAKIDDIEGLAHFSTHDDESFPDMTASMETLWSKLSSLRNQIEQLDNKISVQPEFVFKTNPIFREFQHRLFQEDSSMSSSENS